MTAKAWPTNYRVGQFVRRAAQGQAWEVVAVDRDQYDRPGLVVVRRDKAGQITAREFVPDTEPLYLAR